MATAQLKEPSSSPCYRWMTPLPPPSLPSLIHPPTLIHSPTHLIIHQHALTTTLYSIHLFPSLFQSIDSIQHATEVAISTFTDAIIINRLQQNQIILTCVDTNPWTFLRDIALSFAVDAKRKHIGESDLYTISHNLSHKLS